MVHLILLKSIFLIQLLVEQIISSQIQKRYLPVQCSNTAPPVTTICKQLVMGNYVTRANVDNGKNNAARRVVRRVSQSRVVLLLIPCETSPATTTNSVGMLRRCARNAAVRSAGIPLNPPADTNVCTRGCNKFIGLI